VVVVERPPLTATPARGGTAGVSRATPRRRPVPVTIAALAGTLLALLLVLLAASGGSPAPAPPAAMTIRLTPSGGDYPTFGDAVREAPAGATIVLAPGIYRLERPVDVFRTLRVVGAGSGRTVLACAGQGHVLGFDSAGTLTLDALTVRHVSAADADAPADVVVAMDGRVELDRCSIEGGRDGRGTPRYGAGVYLLGDARLAATGGAVAGNDAAAIVTADRARADLDDVRLRDNGRDAVVAFEHAGPRDRADFDAFIEPVVLRLMTDRHVPGVVVVLVRDGRIVSDRGWGYADLESGTAMDAGRTRLRVASITKVVTTIAVLQLAEEGRLDLRDDVESHLGGLRLPSTYPVPVSIADLLTHSGGLDDGVAGTAARDPRDVVPLATFLARHPATRFARPGRVYSYSNYGMALAGQIVAETSGLPYADYVRDHVLAPLGMRDSSLEPPAQDPGDVAVGYKVEGDGYARIAPDAVNESPSIGLMATGDDMARLAIALLQGGRIDGHRVLRRRTVLGMEMPQFSNAEGLPGSTYGLRERDANGLWAVQQGGDWGGFASLLMLMPDQHLGLFIASNTRGNALREEIAELFLDRYYPLERRIGPATSPSGFAAGAERYVGTYRASRYSHETFEKLYSMTPSEEIVVGARGDLLDLRDVGYAEVDPLLFRQTDSGRKIAFATDADGEIAWLFEETAAYERLDWYETYRFNRRLLIAVVVVFTAALAVWPGVPLIVAVDSTRRRRAARKTNARSDASSAQDKAVGGTANGAETTAAVTRAPRAARAARLTAALAAGLGLTFLAGLGIAFAAIDFVHGVPSWFVGLLALPLLVAALAATLPVFTVVAWARGYWGVATRIQYSVTTVAALAFVWFCWYWNLLGPRL
jgi:CubicO group peptidase (beta-lactamase class C family)